MESEEEEEAGDEEGEEEADNEEDEEEDSEDAEDDDDPEIILKIRSHTKDCKVIDVWHSSTDKVQILEVKNRKSETRSTR